jgi:hypothetical protein
MTELPKNANSVKANVFHVKTKIIVLLAEEIGLVHLFALAQMAILMIGH